MLPFRILAERKTLAAVAMGLLFTAPVQAQQRPATAAVGAAAVETPAVSDTRSRRAVLRFVTEADYPPFNYTDEDGSLTGFNVDIARAICLELTAACDIQAKPWNDLPNAVKRGEADAIIASHTVSARILQQLDVSDRYYHTPARFAGRRGVPPLDVTPGGLDRKRIAVAKGTSHEAFLRAFFTLSAIQSYENTELARDAVITGTADLLFDDGISLVFWLNGTSSKACCEFKGGPFMEPRYFGDGVGILLNRDDPLLKPQVNAALKRIRDSGRYEELILRYFPLRAY
jgi:polar amino acid transport system substrate-binding protein